MTKKQRQGKILELIESYEIDTQEELTEKLNREGFAVSQATVSRDIKELDLSKENGISKKFKYAKTGAAGTEVPQKIIGLFKQVTLSIIPAGNLIVIKTLSGNAGTAGMVIDEMRLSQCIGTIAGDDTLLIITRNNTDAEIIVKRLRTL